MEELKHTMCKDCKAWFFISGTDRGYCRRKAPAPHAIETGKELTTVVPSMGKEDGCFEGIPRG